MAVGGSDKARRQARILELVGSGAVDTQGDLRTRLEDEGFAVTQTTVSRDIRELRLVKVPTPAGGHRYARGEAGLSERMARHLFRECVTGIDHSENLVVLSTLPGTAQSIAEALDGLRAPEVIGTLSGERTVFVVIKPKDAVAGFLARLDSFRGPGGAP